MQQFLFVVDPVETLNPKKDSTVALMRVAARLGCGVYVCSVSDFIFREGKAAVNCSSLQISQNDDNWVSVGDAVIREGKFFTTILMRKEPPVDASYVMATRFLDLMKVPVYNSPRALREWNEKLAILRFPELIPPTWVGRDFLSAQLFCKQYQQVVMKPLDGMGGQGIYVTTAGDLNFRSVFDTLVSEGKMVMLQAYLPAVKEGDNRVFVVDGQALPWVLARIPQENDYRANMAAGGQPIAQRLNKTIASIVERVGPELKKAGIRFAGLDVIGGKLIEINITCPTGLRQIKDQTGDDIAETIWNVLSVDVD